MIVAMDGPAGAGKSTLAREVSRRLGFRLVNTGAIYRAVAWQALERGVPLGNEPALASLARSLKLRWRGEDLEVDGVVVREALRTPEVSEATSVISALPQVREALLDAQRSLARAGDAVLEGRDIGTVVCPDAELKLYVTASVEERARRRLLEYPEGEHTLAEVVEELRRRDARDEGREVAPAVAAADAVVVDTTSLSIEQALDRILGLVEARRGTEESGG